MININAEIAASFLQKADTIDLVGKNKFRAVSFRNAARALEGLDRGVDEIYQKSWLKGLEKIDGIGNRLAHAIEAELHKRGIKR